MKKIADISAFENLMCNTKSVSVSNGIYRDWYDNGMNLTYIGNDWDGVETYGRLMIDCNVEDYLNVTRTGDDINYRPINMSRVRHQLNLKLLEMYEAECMEQGKLTDTDSFIATVDFVLQRGFATEKKVHSSDITPYIEGQCLDMIENYCEGLYDFLQSERPRIAKRVRTAQRWGKDRA